MSAFGGIADMAGTSGGSPLSFVKRAYESARNERFSMGCFYGSRVGHVFLFPRALTTPIPEGGRNITATQRQLQRRQRSLSAIRAGGKSRLRVQTSVCITDRSNDLFDTDRRVLVRYLLLRGWAAGSFKKRLPPRVLADGRRRAWKDRVASLCWVSTGFTN
jgi:hypothetical protein